VRLVRLVAHIPPSPAGPTDAPFVCVCALPLADLWREWIEDEQAAAQTEDDYARIQTLFERAQEDYLSTAMHFLTISRIVWVGPAVRNLIASPALFVLGATLWIRQCQFETARAQLEGADDDEDEDDEDDIEMKDGGDENMRLLAAAERLRGTYGLALAAAGQHYFLVGLVVWSCLLLPNLTQHV
jgi:hypothetical protein